MSGEKLTLDGPTLGVLEDRGAALPVDPHERYYLMVFHGEASTCFTLPRTGSVTIGRSDEAHLRIDDHSVSRRHATLTMDHGEARVADLGSHNGVWVNDERVVASRALFSGDTVTIGSATLVYHASGARPQGRRTLEAAQLRQRLVEEVERAARFSHDLAIVALLPGPDADRIGLDAALGARVRGGDIVGQDGAGGFVVLVPEAVASEAAEAVLAAVLAAAPGARAGFACYPLDGSDPDALLAGARSAAAQATAGRPTPAAEACRTLQVGAVEVIIADPAMQRLFVFVERIAGADLPVLITGETGTGKELVATAIHAMSRRKDGPFRVLRCVALTEARLDDELFGAADRPGRLEGAAGGTLFLDEIGELGPGAQARLLRALESQRVVRGGEENERALDLRVVAATNHAIDEAVQAGKFRRDLYFRLTGVKLWLPPLRDRPRELPILAQRLLAVARQAAGGEPMTIAPEAMRLLAEHPWPGNVRELHNAMSYIAAAYTDAVLRPHHIVDWLASSAAPTSGAEAPAVDPNAPKFRPLEDEIRELEIQRISAALAATRGNQTRAADLIGMPLRTFINKLKRHGIVTDRRS